MSSWYCVYTKRGREEHICQRLAELPEIEVFNPKIETRRRLRSKSTVELDELFPSYIFVKFGSFRYFHLITYTRGVRRIVGDRSGKPFIVDESIIRHIRSRMVDGYVHLPRKEFARGDSVSIVDGPLAGLDGLFVSEMKPSERVLILLSTLQYQAKVIIPKASVARC